MALQCLTAACRWTPPFNKLEQKSICALLPESRRLFCVLKGTICWCNTLPLCSLFCYDDNVDAGIWGGKRAEPVQPWTSVTHSRFVSPRPCVGTRRSPALGGRRDQRFTWVQSNKYNLSTQWLFLISRFLFWLVEAKEPTVKLWTHSEWHKVFPCISQ